MLGLGPIFILVINRSTLYGVWNGIATALGAAMADSLFFTLALLGALNFVQKHQNFILIAESMSGIAIILFGLLMLKQKQREKNLQIKGQSILLTIARSFFLTLLSPFVAIFFMFASIHVVPAGSINLCMHDILAGSITVGLGSFLGLSTIAFMAGSLRSTLNAERIARFGFYSGLLFIGTGIYLVLDSTFKIITALA